METNTRTPRKRGILTSLLTLLAVGYGYSSLNQTWYYLEMVIPNITMPGVERLQTGAVEAKTELTAYTLTLDGTAMSFKGPQAALDSVGGMPVIMILLATICLLVIASAFFQNALFAFAGVILGMYTHNVINNMQTLVENPLYGGSYMQAGPGVEQFTFSLYSIIASGMLVGLYVALNNRKKRQESGEGGVLSTIYSVHQGALAKAASRVENKNLA
jgi:hypothetical protein